MSVGYLACSFDMLNIGHLDLIDQARGLCDRLVVGVLTDEAVERAEGRVPVMPLAERTALISHVRGVDEVTVHDTAPEPGSGVKLVLIDDDGSGPVSVREIALESRRETASLALQAALRSAPAAATAEPISA